MSAASIFVTNLQIVCDSPPYMRVAFFLTLRTNKYCRVYSSFSDIYCPGAVLQLTAVSHLVPAAVKYLNTLT